MSKLELYANVAWKYALAVMLIAFSGAAGVTCYQTVQVRHHLDAVLDGVGSDVHSAAASITNTSNVVNKTVGDSSKLVNANLIQMEIILDNARRVSEQESSFWGALSGRTITTLDKFDSLLDSVNDTSRTLAKVPVHIDSAIDRLSDDSHTSFGAADKAAGDADKSIMSFNEILMSPDIINTIHHFGSISDHIDATASHVEGITGDIQHDVHKYSFKSKRMQILGAVLGALGVADKGAEIYYYMHPGGR